MPRVYPSNTSDIQQETELNQEDFAFNRIGRTVSEVISKNQVGKRVGHAKSRENSMNSSKPAPKPKSWTGLEHQIQKKIPLKYQIDLQEYLLKDTTLLYEDSEGDSESEYILIWPDGSEFQGFVEDYDF